MKELNFGDMTVKPDIRMLSQMTEVVYDGEWLEGTEDVELYYMYRDLGLNEEQRETIRDGGLRYDITIIPSRRMGTEFVKTAGHYHPTVSGTDVSYPELYQVLEGRAHYLTQNADASDVFFVEAGRMDVVLIPPGYGHVTINPSDGPLKMANWVARDFSSLYESMKKKHGAAYFELVGGEWIKNKNYGDIPELRTSGPIVPDLLGLKKDEDMYLLVEDLSTLDFLKNSQDHEDFFQKI